MRSALVGLMHQERASLNSCPACPVKGTCVFVTPGFEPGYCLHEYKLLHAFLAQRLRVHPFAGASQFERFQADARSFVDRLRRERPYDERQARLPVEGVPPPPAWPAQATLETFLPR